MTPPNETEALPDEQKRPAGAPAPTDGATAPPLTLEAVLERVVLVRPAIVDEWKAARVEVRAAGEALGRAMSGDEPTAIAYSAALANNVQRVAVRMARAARALSLAYEALTVDLVVAEAGKWCGSRGADGICTLAAGHDGPHALAGAQLAKLELVRKDGAL